MKLHEKAAAYTAAWNSKDPSQVAAHYAQDGQIIINRGAPHVGTQAMTEMAAGFHSEFPDLYIICDDIRGAGDHAVYRWTLEGHHAETGNFVRAQGWEEWDLDGDGKVTHSRGWFDAKDYQRQIDGG